MNNYIVIENLSSGKFGIVQKVKNKFTDKILAVKIEPDKSCSTLQYEAKIYNLLSGISNIPSIKSYKNDKINNYLFMDLMDYNLKYFKEKHFEIEGTSYIFLVKRIIISLLSTLKNIHSRNIIHRDIKPENICFHNNSIKIIDFGLAKLITLDSIKNKKINNIIGTPNFISLNTTNLNEPGYLDDIESLCYIFIYLIIDNNKFVEYSEEDLINKKHISTIKKYIVNRDYLNIINFHLENCRVDFTENIYQRIVDVYS